MLLLILRRLKLNWARISNHCNLNWHGSHWLFVENVVVKSVWSTLSILVASPVSYWGCLGLLDLIISSWGYVLQLLGSVWSNWLLVSINIAFVQ